MEYIERLAFRHTDAAKVSIMVSGLVRRSSGCQDGKVSGHRDDLQPQDDIITEEFYH